MNKERESIKKGIFFQTIESEYWRRKNMALSESLISVDLMDYSK